MEFNLTGALSTVNSSNNHPSNFPTIWYRLMVDMEQCNSNGRSLIFKYQGLELATND